METRSTATVDVKNIKGAVELWHHQFAYDIANLDILADGGYVDQARERVALYATYLRHGRPMPTEHFLRLCGWLDRIAAGEDPARVLGTARRRRGSPPSIETLEELDRIARTIWGLSRGFGGAKKLAIHPSAKGGGAIAKAATLHGVSEAKAGQAWDVYGKSYETLERTWQQGPPNLAALKRTKGRKKVQPMR